MSCKFLVMLLLGVYRRFNFSNQTAECLLENEANKEFKKYSITPAGVFQFFDFQIAPVPRGRMELLSKPADKNYNSLTTVCFYSALVLEQYILSLL